MDVKLGTVLTDSPNHPRGDFRDAVHCAVLPVILGESCSPGDHVGVDRIEDGWYVVTRKAQQLQGIVDPFLRGTLQPHTKCWLLLYPGTVTGMRHHWHEPYLDEIMPENDEYRRAEYWLKTYAQESGASSYERMMEGIKGFLEDHGSYCYGDDDGPEYFWKLSDEDRRKFWRYVYIVLNQKMSDDVLDELECSSPFRCAC